MVYIVWYKITLLFCSIFQYNNFQNFISIINQYFIYFTYRWDNSGRIAKLFSLNSAFFFSAGIIGKAIMIVLNIICYWKKKIVNVIGLYLLYYSIFNNNYLQI